MDEISMVCRLLAEPPPAPDVVAEGRERLFGSLHGGVRISRSASGIRRTRPRRSAAFWSTLGLTGAAGAAVLAVAMLMPGAGTSAGWQGSRPDRRVGTERLARRRGACRVGGDERHLLARAVDVQDDLAAEVRARRQPVHAGAGVGHREMDHARRPDLVGPPRVGAAEDCAGQSRVAAGRCAEQVVHWENGHGAARADLPAYRARHCLSDALRPGHIRGDRRTCADLRAAPAAAAGPRRAAGLAGRHRPARPRPIGLQPPWWIKMWPASSPTCS